MKKWIISLFSLTILFACQIENKNQSNEEPKKEVKRIVSLHGTLSEILVELGLEKELVGVDVTSTYPKSLEKITNLGHVRALQIEPILSTKPTHVLVFADEINPELEGQLKQAKVEVIKLERDYSIEGTQKVIQAIGAFTGKADEADKLIETVKKSTSSLKKASNKGNQPKVLFIYARGAGTLMVAGEGTPLEKMIQLANGQNAVSGFDDFKPLTPETVIAANPDIILMFDSGAQSLQGTEGILAIPGIKQTNAGKNKKIITMDGQLLSGFGPRIGDAIQMLNTKFYEN